MLYLTSFISFINYRLALYQGAAASYVIPLLIIGSIDNTFCSTEEAIQTKTSNAILC